MNFKLLIGLILIVATMGCTNEDPNRGIIGISDPNPLEGTAANVTISYFIGEDPISPNPVYIRYFQGNGRIPFDYDKIVRFNATVGDEILVLDSDKNIFCEPFSDVFKIEKQIEHWTKECVNVSKKEEIKIYIYDDMNMEIDEINGTFIIPIFAWQDDIRFTILLMNRGDYFNVGGILFSLDRDIKKVRVSPESGFDLWEVSYLRRHSTKGYYLKNYELRDTILLKYDEQRLGVVVDIAYGRLLGYGWHYNQSAPPVDAGLNITIYDARLFFDEELDDFVIEGEQHWGEDVGIEDIELKILFRYGGEL